MEIVAYLITLANIQGFLSSDKQLKDLSVTIAEVSNLANEIKNYPGIDLEAFKKNYYCEVGNVGIYLSKPLRKYLFEENVDPHEEGTILYLIYQTRDPDAPKQSIGDDDGGSVTYLVRREGLKEEEAGPVLQEYMNRKSGSRSRRSLLDYLKS